MEEVKDFAFLEKMDMESLKELIRAAMLQIDERGGIANQSWSEQVIQLAQQVREHVSVEFVEEVEQFDEQCLRLLEIDEYEEGERIGVSIAVVYKLYEIWCETQGIDCMSQKIFTLAMKNLGYCKARGECLVKSYAADQVVDRQPIFFYIVPKIEDTLLQEKIHEILIERERWWGACSEEYQQLHALEVWFNKEDK